MDDGSWNEIEFLKRQLINLMTSKIEEIKDAESRTGKPYPELTFEQAESDEKFDAWNDKYFGGERPDVRYKNGDITQEEFCVFALRLSLRYVSGMEWELKKNNLYGISCAISTFHNANELMKMYYGIQNGSIAFDVAKTKLAAMGGRARAEFTQKEKNIVYEWWLDWQKHPKKYKGKAAFARDMIKDLDHTKDVRTITEKWCNEWEELHSAG